MKILKPSAGAAPSSDCPDTDEAVREVGRTDHHDKWRSAAGLAMSYPALHDRALEFSDHVPFHMRDTWVWDPVELSFSLIVMLSPFILVALVYVYFRRQYFPRSPQAPPGKGGELEPTLTCTRQCFIEALLEVAEGRRPTRKSEPPAPLLPFRNVPARHHVVLGVDLDLRDEDELAERAVASPGWTCCAVGEANPPIPANARAVVVGNLDIALS